MSKKYQNVGFAADKSQFIDATSNPAGANSLLFTNSVKQAPLSGGGKKAMTSGSLTVNLPRTVVGSAGAQDTQLNESLKVLWNFGRGDAVKLTALRAELNRALDEAIANHNLTHGLVPPVSAIFAEG